MNNTWNLNKILSSFSQVLLALVALINISCQSEIAAKFPDSFGTPPNGDGGDEVTETSNGVDLTKPFIFKWRLIDDENPRDKTVTLPLRKNFNYNFVVDWGDGSPSSTITSWDDSDKVHTYPDYDEYTVTLSGLAEAWHFNYGFYIDGEDYIYDENNSHRKISEVT